MFVIKIVIIPIINKLKYFRIDMALNFFNLNFLIVFKVKEEYYEIQKKIKNIYKFILKIYIRFYHNAAQRAGNKN